MFGKMQHSRVPRRKIGRSLIVTRLPFEEMVRIPVLSVFVSAIVSPSTFAFSVTVISKRSGLNSSQSLLLWLRGISHLNFIVSGLILNCLSMGSRHGTAICMNAVPPGLAVALAMWTTTLYLFLLSVG